MKKTTLTIVLTVFAVCFAATNAAAHCEIPCGIYDDAARIKQLGEHITTMEKSMKRIIALQKETPVNSNQLVRWIMNKEDHANAFQEIVTQYFMTQRIKPSTQAYSEKLILLHKMLVYAMKCKQTVDLANIEALRSLLKEFEGLYM
ncbi:MAG: superoxide dismutase [Deltaproteobacteria bacterium]|nr:superoxide dismutase [Deltaproteobacteria bacterium]MBW1815798.1 superoxide dismutase [Deltaproteobacteria bacterium]